MRRISLNAEDWTSREDFYSALLPELGAPEWHGRNLDALYDSLAGGINALAPPFAVEIAGTAGRPPELRSFLAQVMKVFDDARLNFGDDVSLTLL